MDCTKEEVGLDKRELLKTTKKIVLPDSDLILQGHCMVLCKSPEGFKVQGDKNTNTFDNLDFLWDNRLYRQIFWISAVDY